MSLARFGADGSDVYVFEMACREDSVFECCGCLLWKEGDDSTSALTAQEMIDHLKKHVEAGHIVPDYTLEELRERGDLL